MKRILKKQGTKIFRLNKSKYSNRNKYANRLESKNLIKKRDKEDDYFYSAESQSTSVSPKTKKDLCSSSFLSLNDDPRRSLSFQNITELPSTNPGFSSKWIYWRRIGIQKSLNTWKEHNKSPSWVKKTNHIYLNELQSTVTINKWDDPFEKKHVYPEPTLTKKAKEGLAYLGRFRVEDAASQDKKLR